MKTTMQAKTNTTALTNIDEQDASQPIVNALLTPTPSKKKNPAADLIGRKIVSDKMVSINFRKGKANVIACSEIEIVAANATGRRLECILRDLDGKVVLSRRIYREWIEEAESKFNK